MEAMQELPSFLIQILAASPLLTYSALVLFAAFEGPVLFIVCGFLINQEALAVVPTFLALMLGDLIGDTFWYVVGYFFAGKALRKHGKFLFLTPERLERTERLYQNHQKKLLFLSKVTLGFGTSTGAVPILLAAGITRIPYGRFILLCMAGEVILLSVMLGIGYTFGASFAALSKDFRLAFLIVAGIMVLTAGTVLVRHARKVPGDAQSPA
jgi:membrane protein DedA with SNARE-associated domain